MKAENSSFPAFFVFLFVDDVGAMLGGQVPLQEERCGEATTLLLRIPAG